MSPVDYGDGEFPIQRQSDQASGFPCLIGAVDEPAHTVEDLPLTRALWAVRAPPLRELSAVKRAP